MTIISFICLIWKCLILKYDSKYPFQIIRLYSDFLKVCYKMQLPLPQGAGPGKLRVQKTGIYIPSPLKIRIKRLGHYK